MLLAFYLLKRRNISKGCVRKFCQYVLAIFSMTLNHIHQGNCFFSCHLVCDKDSFWLCLFFHAFNQFNSTRKKQKRIINTFLLVIILFVHSVVIFLHSLTLEKCFNHYATSPFSRAGLLLFCSRESSELSSMTF